MFKKIFAKLADAQGRPWEYGGNSSMDSMDKLIGLGGQKKLKSAVSSLLDLQVAKGLPGEFWKKVDQIKKRRVLDLGDYQKIVDMIDRYQAKRRAANEKKAN